MQANANNHVKRRLNSPMQLLLQRSKKQSFWAIKIKFFSGPLIDFMLHLLDIAFIILVQWSPFSYILPDQSVCIFVQPPLPWEYGWQKKNPASNFFAISLCSANSVPLSAVIVCTHFLYGNSIRITVFASPTAFFSPVSFSINRNPVFLSVSVTMAPFPSFPIIVSISQSPMRERSSTTGGRFSMDTLSLMGEIHRPAFSGVWAYAASAYRVFPRSPYPPWWTGRSAYGWPLAFPRAGPDPQSVPESIVRYLSLL